MGLACAVRGPRGGLTLHLLGRFSVADLYLLVFSLWRAVAGPLPASPNLDAFQMRLLARPGIGPAIGEEMRLRAEAA